jgi:hypothetical protein
VPWYNYTGSENRLPGPDPAKASNMNIYYNIAKKHMQNDEDVKVQDLSFAAAMTCKGHVVKDIEITLVGGRRSRTVGTFVLARDDSFGDDEEDYFSDRMTVNPKAMANAMRDLKSRIRLQEDRIYGEDR